MNPNPSREDITEAVCSIAGGPPARFVYAEGSEERTGDSDDSMGFWRHTDGSIWHHTENGWEPLPSPNYKRGPLGRNPELDRIDDRIRDWARQNLEEIRQPE